MAYFIPMNPNLHSYLAGTLHYFEPITKDFITASFYWHLQRTLQATAQTDPFTFFELIDERAREIIKVSIAGAVPGFPQLTDMTLIFERGIGDSPLEWVKKSRIIAGDEQSMTQLAIIANTPSAGMSSIVTDNTDDDVLLSGAGTADTPLKAKAQPALNTLMKADGSNSAAGFLKSVAVDGTTIKGDGATIPLSAVNSGGTLASVDVKSGIDINMSGNGTPASPVTASANPPLSTLMKADGSNSTAGFIKNADITVTVQLLTFQINNV